MKFEEKTEDLETEDRREEAALVWIVAAIIDHRYDLPLGILPRDHIVTGLE